MIELISTAVQELVKTEQKILRHEVESLEPGVVRLEVVEGPRSIDDIAGEFGGSSTHIVGQLSALDDAYEYPRLRRQHDPQVLGVLSKSKSSLLPHPFAGLHTFPFYNFRFTDPSSDEHYKNKGAKIAEKNAICYICNEGVDEGKYVILYPCGHWVDRICYHTWKAGGLQVKCAYRCRKNQRSFRSPELMGEEVCIASTLVQISCLMFNSMMLMRPN